MLLNSVEEDVKHETAVMIKEMTVRLKKNLLREHVIM